MNEKLKSDDNSTLHTTTNTHFQLPTRGCLQWREIIKKRKWWDWVACTDLIGNCKMTRLPLPIKSLQAITNGLYLWKSVRRNEKMRIRMLYDTIRLNVTREVNLKDGIFAKKKKKPRMYVLLLQYWPYVEFHNGFSFALQTCVIINLTTFVYYYY